MAVTSFRITQRSTVLDGRPVGDAGAYEKIAGVLQIAVDPKNPANEAIADLTLAPRNAAGLVECESDFYVLRPRDAGRGNRRLFLDVPNRGRKVALGMLNSTVRVADPSAPEDFGNGFLMRHGYTVAWCGWQHDVPRQDGLLALTVPAARGDNGPITGQLLCEWRPNTRVATLRLADRYHIAHPAADLDDPVARLTVREHAGVQRPHRLRLVAEEFVADALAQHQKLLAWMANSLTSGAYLAGNAFSNADAAVIPYILRLELLKLSGMWAQYPAVADWWARMRERPSVKATIFERMGDADWAPFRNLSPDPWPKVQTILKAA